QARTDRVSGAQPAASLGGRWPDAFGRRVSTCASDRRCVGIKAAFLDHRREVLPESVRAESLRKGEDSVGTPQPDLRVPRELQSEASSGVEPWWNVALSDRNNALPQAVHVARLSGRSQVGQPGPGLAKDSRRTNWAYHGLDVRNLEPRHSVEKQFELGAQSLGVDFALPHDCGSVAEARQGIHGPRIAPTILGEFGFPERAVPFGN